MRVWWLSTTRRLARVAALPWPQRLLLVEALGAVALGTLLLRLVPFRTLARWLGRPARAAAPAGRVAAPEAVGWSVQAVAAAVPWKALCLVQAIAATMMLRRRGVPVSLSLGVRRTGQGLEAHAWTEAGGRIVTGAGALGTYTKVLTLPEQGGEPATSAAAAAA